ncbi:hypothetical protein CWI39_1495p0010 [Hamiltosporidium magnivora]|uniref:Uncharacterized protein n=1 Tax=Hamiltosporidium magnivora TaxID=148818 RepID=A0A4V2JUQ0_9MICR|nr:hypothetical protein CWI39_1495p0010 [Hamiltosporidium magnivora]
MNTMRAEYQSLETPSIASGEKMKTGIKWYKTWYFATKNFLLDFLSFCQVVAIDLIIVCFFEIIFFRKIRTGRLFFVTVAHLFLRSFSEEDSHKFYGNIMSGNKDFAYLRILIRVSYFVISIIDFLLKDVLENFYVTNNYFIAFVIYSLWSIFSFFSLLFLVRLYPFCVICEGVPKKEFTFLTLPFFVFIEVSYEISALLAHICSNFEFMHALPSYLVVSVFSCILGIFAAELNDHFIIFCSFMVYTCMNWQFLFNLLKFIWYSFGSHQINLS